MATITLSSVTGVVAAAAAAHGASQLLGACYLTCITLQQPREASFIIPILRGGAHESEMAAG